ncbi:MAG: hypothetical protein CL605_01755 [Altibacter sp.]|uniref:hypothetical protein n=1 Tax=Altibacter sp. TaxID=2024823 RepID=UPI000C91A0BD|nr:hypothetical protein [Altibacter sp.]MAP53605.1 hypothetical protein [Altibacter sp.]|tara:strand:- start:25285 stop:26919 length:1635 start_codon:yes stop_codon:yes gene_type:complete
MNMGLRDSLRNLIRRRTPTPVNDEVYNMGIQERRLPQHYAGKYLYSMAQNSTVVRTCLVQLKTEIFRRGYEWVKAFDLKCSDCGYEHHKEVDACSSCGSTNLRRPDLQQKLYAFDFFEGYVNSSHQLFIDVLKELETDMNIIDDAYLILVKDYYLDKNGEIIMSKINEIYRGDPTTIYIEVDEDGDRGHSRYTCITHRDFVSEDKYDKCAVCGSSLHPIEFVNKSRGEDQNYIMGEVVHFSKYSPSRLYGHPPVLTLFNHIFTLTAMESYISTLYTKARTPRGILAVQTNNMESLVKYWKGVKEKLERDPHYTPIMGIETEGGSRGSVEWVPFTNTIKEMDYINVKDDLRTRVSSFYGVSNIFTGDTTTGGGLNNEGMQILVTNRAVEKAQNVYNKYMFPFLMKQFGITDWKVQLLRSEEEDEIANIRRREMELQLAIQMKNLGFEVDMNEDGDFVFKKYPAKELIDVDVESDEKPLETDPYAGTNIDRSQLGQLQEQALMSGNTKAQVAGETSMEKGPPKRFSGLPKEAGNNNVDSRTERRIP